MPRGSRAGSQESDFGDEVLPGRSSIDFYFLRHGLRLDQQELKWRQTAQAPYDTPLAPIGLVQSQLAGRAIVSRSTTALQESDNGRNVPKHRQQNPARKFIIHTSPFLRCIQTAIALASTIQQLTGARPLLRVDCFLGEWLTPDYYKDISPPPPMPKMAAKATGDLDRKDNSDMRDLGNPGRCSLLRTADSSNVSSPKELDVLIDSVKFDSTWDSSFFGQGSAYGEDWPEMLIRFKASLQGLVQFYSRTSSDSIQNTDATSNSGNGTTVVMVTHAAGCNAMIGAVTGKPVILDIDIGALSHFVPRKGDTQSDIDVPNNELRHCYRLLLSASTEHLSIIRSPSSANLRQWPNDVQRSGNSIGRSGSWHKAVGRSASTQFPQKTGLWCSSSNSPQDSRRSSLTVESASQVNLATTNDEAHSDKLTTAFANRGRQRSFTTTT